MKKTWTRNIETPTHNRGPLHKNAFITLQQTVRASTARKYKNVFDTEFKSRARKQYNLNDLYRKHSILLSRQHYKGRILRRAIDNITGEQSITECIKESKQMCHIVDRINHLCTEQYKERSRKMDIISKYGKYIVVKPILLSRSFISRYGKL